MLGQSSNYAFDYATIMPTNMLNYAELCSVPLCIHAVHRGLRNHAYTHGHALLFLSKPKDYADLTRWNPYIMPEHNNLTKSQDYAKYYAGINRQGLIIDGFSGEKKKLSQTERSLSTEAEVQTGGGGGGGGAASLLHHSIRHHIIRQ